MPYADNLLGAKSVAHTHSRRVVRCEQWNNREECDPSSSSEPLAVSHLQQSPDNRHHQMISTDDARMMDELVVMIVNGYMVLFQSDPEAFWNIMRPPLFTPLKLLPPWLSPPAPANPENPSQIKIQKEDA
jgi:esterase/lipase superfamily enzyme